MTDLIPAELLEKGAAYIEEHGLWKGAFWPDYEASVSTRQALREGLPACAMGALKIADLRDAEAPWRPGYSEAVVALSSSLDESIPDWNDALGRTVAEVADAMRACATNLRGA